MLRGRLRLPGGATRLIDRCLDRGSITARGYDRVLRVAWTVADLDDCGPRQEHVEQAWFLRTLGQAA